MHPFIAASLVTQWNADVSRGSGRPTTRGRPEGGLRRREPRATAAAAPELVIRRATAADAPALRRLAALDGQTRAGDALAARAGDVLVAEADGSLEAAVSLDGELSVADPFRPSAVDAELLALRARQLGGAAPHGHRGRLGVLHPRTS
jgi:hypothetical protein